MLTITLTDKQAEAVFRAATNPSFGGNRALSDALKRMTDEQTKQLELDRAEVTLREQLQREDAGPPLIGDNDLRTCLKAVRQAQGKGWTT